MRVSVYDFFNVAKPKTFGKERKVVGRSRQATSILPQGTLSDAFRETVAADIRDAYVLTREHRSPTPSHLNSCVWRTPIRLMPLLQVYLCLKIVLTNYQVKDNEAVLISNLEKINTEYLWNAKAV